MKKLMKLSIAAGVLFLGANLWAGKIPAGKEKLTIDHVAGDKGAVVFAHADHGSKRKKKDGSSIECKDCHHDFSNSGSPKACGGCHAGLDAPQKEIEGKKAPNLAETKGGKVNAKSVLMHASCKDGCHKEVGKSAAGTKLTSCKTCHP